MKFWKVRNNKIITKGNKALTQNYKQLLVEKFESPVVSGYSQGSIPSKWLIANQGFGSDRCGLNNKDGGDWTTPDYTNNQVFCFRYTNSGLATKPGVIGPLDSNNIKYTVSFDAILDQTAGTPYYVQLAVIDTGNRQDFRSAIPVGIYELNKLNGNVPADGKFHSYTFSYTTDPIVDAAFAGQDIAIRMKGATTSANIDNVRVTYQPV